MLANVDHFPVTLKEAKAEVDSSLTHMSKPERLYFVTAGVANLCPPTVARLHSMFTGAVESWSANIRSATC